jgi:small subunit ribosomal protein S30e
MWFNLLEYGIAIIIKYLSIESMGKVHGSLARNGKVRNQAPKVAKAERAKKRVTGRCKKRQQYNKRILAVDPNDKRKKGPNFGAGRKPEDIPK